MKKVVLVVLIMVLLLAVASTAFAGNGNGNGKGNGPCWGQATAVFAQTGEMGAHSSSFPTPRLGLANLARELFGPDGTMAELGAYVAAELGLSIDACL
jgi:hypothetical protein